MKKPPWLPHIFFIDFITLCVYVFCPSTDTNIRQRFPDLKPSAFSALSARVFSKLLVLKAISVSSGSDILKRWGVPMPPCMQLRIARHADEKSLKMNELY